MRTLFSIAKFILSLIALIVLDELWSKMKNRLKNRKRKLVVVK